MWSKFATLLLAAATCPAQWESRILTRLRGGVHGGQLANGRVYAWGDGLWVAGRHVAGGRFAAGGCIWDVNQDGRPDLVALESGEMVWLEAGSWRRRVIDTGADFRDCMGTELFGQRGLLVIHRYAQVRFYTPVSSGRWPYREIYSIYTPSAQGGLALADVDGDGRKDILCGNYWIRAPGSVESGWRLFAIGNWWEGERSAMLRLAVESGRRLVAAQSDASPARIAWFEQPADPTQFWRMTPIEVSPPLRNIRGLVLLGEDRVAAAEDAGAGSRVVVWDGGVKEVARTEGLLGLWWFGGRLVGLARDSVIEWRQRRR